MGDNSGAKRTILKGGHVIDPAQSINKVTDVIIEGGKIVSVGGAKTSSDDVIDADGLYVSPGFVDIHIHAYGALGFAEPDSLGIWQGVTSFVEAGGPGVGTFDEFLAVMEGRTVTDLYAGLWLRPMGLIGVNYIEGDPRGLMNIDINSWLDLAETHSDVFRYLKIGAFGRAGTGPLRIGKGLAEVLGVPAYFHIGEFQETPPQITTAKAFQISEAGDIITHIYHGNPGGTLDEEGNILKEVREADRRGVLFDVGFGGYNFSWRVAERAFSQGLVPYTISSDLQQHNVNGPAYSLANVMTVMLRLGMSLTEVIERVTINAARSISIEDRAGSLSVGGPADITLFRIDEGEFELADCQMVTRTAEKSLVPVMAFKDGIRYDSDMERCRDERNWFWQIAEDKIPTAAETFSALQRNFLLVLAAELEKFEWKMGHAEQLDIFTATKLQEYFHEVRRKSDISLGDALQAVYGCFLDNPFTMQVGLFLFRLDKKFAIERLNNVAKMPRNVAA